MVSDNTTFFIAFASMFGGIALYLWRLERLATRLEDRLARVARERAPEPGGPDD